MGYDVTIERITDTALIALQANDRARAGIERVLGSPLGRYLAAQMSQVCAASRSSSCRPRE